MNSGKTFEFDGQRFAYVTNPDDFTLDEMDVVLGWLVELGILDVEDAEASIRVLNRPQHKMKLLKVLMWCSIQRSRPDFTLADAGKVNLAVVSAAAAAPARKVPTDRKAPAGAVLSPTRPASGATRKRASPRTTSRSSGASTGRSSRVSTASRRTTSDD